ncbi:hypothetical protein [Kitasatospora sp. NPDC059327]|uniref:hypothetical protein n=1 Tax=Kitasatospora sp. NPDC059327 TaxID=3346803 RepID=UPI0036BE81E7
MGPDDDADADIGDVLDQETWWVDRHGDRHRITEMELRYCRNIIAFLERQAEDIADVYAYNLTIVGLPPEHTHAWDEVNDSIGSEMAAMGRDPLRWLRSKPLLVALRRRLGEGDGAWRELF